VRLNQKSYIILAILTLLAFSCSKNNFEVTEFNPFINYSTKKNDSTFSITTDLSDAIFYGVQIPSIKQLPNGKFVFNFKIKNNNKSQNFFYKLYYQNESYKWQNGDSLDHENFYGSWEEAQLEFKITPLVDKELNVTDSFCIIGNPRDEQLYYGANPVDVKINDTIVAFFKHAIFSQNDWVKSIKQKAVENKITFDKQVYLEAVWSTDHYFQTLTKENNRYKRNPRMGNYKFMLVVCNGKGLLKIPIEIRNIASTNSSGNYTNPFTYFLSETAKNLEGVKIISPKTQLAVSSKLNTGAGIYVDNLKYNNSDLNASLFSNRCGTSDELRRKAHFSQFFNHINKNFKLVNIKEIKDIVGDNITREDYEKLVSSYGKSKNFIHTFSYSTDCPCKTVSSDSVSNSITVLNPGNQANQFKKEHVGIMSRVGFTYGKWRAKIKFPKIISNDNVWNGLTSAFWLIFQADANWNNRRICHSKVGYIPKGVEDNVDATKQSQLTVTYSEIDFEILKENNYWPKGNYRENYVKPTYDSYNNNDITICCTNWDMGCQQPKNYVIGAKKVNVEGKEYEFCRWDFFNKLVTSKQVAPHKEVFNDDFYYFEIDWQPQRIIWRIGKNKNNLKEICRMDDKMTSIPNNQMVMVLSQEFHYQEWWPTAPFKQNYIPFPKNNLIGKLLEVEID